MDYMRFAAGPVPAGYGFVHGPGALRLTIGFDCGREAAMAQVRPSARRRFTARFRAFSQKFLGSVGARPAVQGKLWTASFCAIGIGPLCVGQADSSKAPGPSILSDPII